MTTVRKILFCLALVSTIALVHSKHASLSKGVFPDDPQWPSLWNRRESENSEKDGETKKFKICETTECKKVAEEFLSSMNKSINPCEDFYEFSCGAWTADAIPPNMPAWSRFMIFRNTVKHRIKEALMTKPEPSDILPVRQAKKWYRSCMDSDTLERRGVRPIESILMQAGGWPISMNEQEWDAKEYTWQKVGREYRRITGSDVFYNVDTMAPWGGEPLGTILIKGAQIPLSDQLPLKYRDYIGNDYETYVKLVESVANLFAQHTGADVSRDKIRKQAEEIVEFEKEIYKLNKDASGYTEMTFEKFVEWYETDATAAPLGTAPLLNWKSLIQDLFDMVSIEILPSAGIILNNKAYFRGIDELLRKTSPRTIVNYIHWKFVGNTMAYTTEHVRDILFELLKEEYGVKKKHPRWIKCVNDMKMTHAAAYAFVAKFFTKSTETAAHEMIKNIRMELEEKIDKSNWLDEETKIMAKGKLNTMKIFVGFPDWYKNQTAMINLYKGLTIGADYFDNSLSYMKYERKKELKNYAIPLGDEEPWFMDPVTVNAIYRPNVNTVNLPAANFQPPLFTSGLPDNVNYAIAGLIVGHEISHGFDVDGIRFGRYGNVTELSKDMKKAYYQRAECFLDQFEDYYGETKPPKHEGSTSGYDAMGSERSDSKAGQTRGENIADTTGVQAVFQAYKKLENPDRYSRLPGLEEFTDDQLFFLSFAAMWCEIGTPQYQKKREQKVNSHSPPRYRVIGAVSNTKDFARAFNCPEGSSMNPINKCDIWKKPGAVPKSQPDRSDRNVYEWGGQWSQ